MRRKMEGSLPLCEFLKKGEDNEKRQIAYYPFCWICSAFCWSYIKCKTIDFGGRNINNADYSNVSIFALYKRRERRTIGRR